jgi:GNAT superfamily N-acetyltransferase
MFSFPIQKMEVTIRSISIEDSQEVNNLSLQLGYNLFIIETKKQIEKVIATENHCAFVAVSEKRVIGWIHAFVSLAIESRPLVEIAGLVIDQQYRSHGIGNKLIERIREWTASIKINTLRVRTNTKRLQAHQFYLKNGFTELKEQKVFQLDLNN